MDYGESLQASFWTMMALQTIGSIDMPGAGERKMPSPRSYLAVIVMWAILQLFADTGGSRGRLASSLGWLTVLTGMVVGPFGTQVSKLFTGVVNIATGSSGTSQTQTGNQNEPQ